jgi:uncharacterized circularly permuted ATP-grasp superfamily protein
MNKRKRVNYDMQPEDIAHLWTLVCNLTAANYCISQLEPKLPRQMWMKRLMKELRQQNERFLYFGQQQATEDQKEILDRLSNDSVAAIAEMMMILSHLPVDKIDWFCDRIVSMAKGVIISEHDKTLVDGNI